MYSNHVLSDGGERGCGFLGKDQTKHQVMECCIYPLKKPCVLGLHLASWTRGLWYLHSPHPRAGAPMSCWGKGSHTVGSEMPAEWPCHCLLIFDGDLLPHQCLIFDPDLIRIKFDSSFVCLFVLATQTYRILPQPAPKSSTHIF